MRRQSHSLQVAECTRLRPDTKALRRRGRDQESREDPANARTVEESPSCALSTERLMLSYCLPLPVPATVSLNGAAGFLSACRMH